MCCGFRYHCPSADRAPGQLGAWARGCGLGHSGRAFWKLSSLPASPSLPWIAPFFLRPPTGSSAAPGLWPGEGLGSPPAPAALEEVVGVGTSLASRSPLPLVHPEPNHSGLPFPLWLVLLPGSVAKTVLSKCLLAPAGLGDQETGSCPCWRLARGCRGQWGCQARSSTLPTRCPCVGGFLGYSPCTPGFWVPRVPRSQGIFSDAAPLVCTGCTPHCYFTLQPVPSISPSGLWSLWAAVGRLAPLGL